MQTLIFMWVTEQFHQLVTENVISYCDLNRALEPGNIQDISCFRVLPGSIRKTAEYK